MDANVLELIRVFLSETWRLMTSVTIPGTSFSPAVLLVGVALVALGLRVLSLILGVSFGGGESYRSQSRRGRVSDERSGDEK